MHIVQVANFVTPTSGGLRRTLEALGRRYVAAGHRCTLVHPAAERGSAVNGGVQLERMPGLTLPASGGYRVIVRRAELQRVVVAARPDVVELSDTTTLSWLPAWLRRRGIPTVLVAHDRHEHVFTGRFPDWMPWRSEVDRRRRTAAVDSAAVVCASAFCAEPFVAIGLTPQRIALGVDLETFHPRRAPAPHLVGDPAVELAFVARLAAEKRPEVAIEALRALRADGLDVRLGVVGDGPLRGRVEARATGLPVTFYGHLEARVDVATVLAGARIVLAPCGTETFGLGVLEALACATPVVVPPDGAGRELLVEHAGVVAAPEPGAMAAAVCALLRGDPITQRRACRRHAERFNWESTAMAMLDVFGRVAAESTRCRRAS